jgi:hypothetical protein
MGHQTHTHMFENYTLKIELVDGNKRHLLIFPKICKDKLLIKCKFEI